MTSRDWPGIAGRVALVGGGAGGIGRAIVATLAAAGAQVAALDRVAADGPGMALVADLTDEGAVRAAVARVGAELGPVGLLVNAAGRVGAGPLSATSLADWTALLHDNLTASFLLCREAHAGLRRSGGAVVLIGSIRGHDGGATSSGPAYAAAKAGVANLVRYLAKEWAPDAIRVNGVIPGAVETPMLARLNHDQRAALLARIPLGRTATAAEIAAAVAFLCSNHAASATGALLNLSNGEWIA